MIGNHKEESSYEKNQTNNHPDFVFGDRKLKRGQKTQKGNSCSSLGPQEDNMVILTNKSLESAKTGESGGIDSIDLKWVRGRDKNEIDSKAKNEESKFR